MLGACSFSARSTYFLALYVRLRDRGARYGSSSRLLFFSSFSNILTHHFRWLSARCVAGSVRIPAGDKPHWALPLLPRVQRAVVRQSVWRRQHSRVLVVLPYRDLGHRDREEGEESVHQRQIIR